MADWPSHVGEEQVDKAGGSRREAQDVQLLIHKDGGDARAGRRLRVNGADEELRNPAGLRFPMERPGQLGQVMFSLRRAHLLCVGSQSLDLTFPGMRFISVAND